MQQVFFRKVTIYNSNFPNLHTLILLTFTVNVGNSNPSFLRFSFANYFMVSIYFTKYRSITWVNFKNQLHIRGKSMNLYLPSSKVSFSKLTKCILWTQVSYFSWWITVRLLNTNHLPNLGHRVKFFIPLLPMQYNAVHVITFFETTLIGSYSG